MFFSYSFDKTGHIKSRNKYKDHFATHCVCLQEYVDEALMDLHDTNNKPKPTAGC